MRVDSCLLVYEAMCAVQARPAAVVPRETDTMTETVPPADLSLLCSGLTHCLFVLSGREGLVVTGR